MYKLVRVYYHNAKAADPGQTVRGAVTHLDNGYGKPLCTVRGEGFKHNSTRKTWERESGLPTCDRCKLRLDRVEETCGGDAA